MAHKVGKIEKLKEYNQQNLVSDHHGHPVDTVAQDGLAHLKALALSSSLLRMTLKVTASSRSSPSSTANTVCAAIESFISSKSSSKSDLDRSFSSLDLES